MKISVHVSSYTWAGGPQRLAQDLTRVAQAAEANGFDKLSVMDHLWQTARNGPPEHEMLEAYTTLGYLAARTTRIQLLALVTAVIYREPGLLAKAVTTLDVLSEGRAWLGIGAASSEQEAGDAAIQADLECCIAVSLSPSVTNRRYLGPGRKCLAAAGSVRESRHGGYHRGWRVSIWGPGAHNE